MPSADSVTRSGALNAGENRSASRWRCAAAIPWSRWMIRSPAGERCAGQAKSVSSTATAVYLLTASGVESYGYDGTHNWSRDYGAAPQAVINARETLVFISGTVEVLNAPHE